jgi:poly(3-hydroxybutyrate) depolymerase
MRSRATATVLIGASFALLAACSGDNGGKTPDASAQPDAAAQRDAPPRDGGSPTDPKKLVRDKATACPSAFAGASPKAGRNTGFEVEGQQRAFQLRLPAASLAGPRPLMVYFHGTNGSGDAILTLGWADELLKRGFIVVGPDGEDNGSVWPEWDAMREPSDRTRKNLDVAFFDRLVDCLAAHLEVDERRIYISGMSAGGIMTNRVLRERSQLLAGGVVGSGAFDLTDPVTPGPLGPMAVLVAWGGDNDEWGGTNAGKTVPKFNFAQQSALASQHYEKAPGVHQVHCRGDNLGHSWLASVNELMAGFLAAHPKGLATNQAWKLEPPPASAKVTCSEEAAATAAKVEVTCAAGPKPECQVYCQQIADCVVENDTVRPVLGPQLLDLGFAGKDYTECAGCVSACEKDLAQGVAVDAQVMTCFKGSIKACGAGIDAALVVADQVNQCCKDQLTSAICSRLCKTINKNTVAAGFFGACKPFPP